MKIELQVIVCFCPTNPNKPFTSRSSDLFVAHGLNFLEK